MWEPPGCWGFEIGLWVSMVVGVPACEGLVLFVCGCDVWISGFKKSRGGASFGGMGMWVSRDIGHMS